MSTPFHLGLCLAGSVSAGAYTAGVLDYLFETLERWEQEKIKGNSTVPKHEVVIDVFSGASGGGMCGIISSIVLQAEGDYVSGNHSLLFKTWVELNDGLDEKRSLTWQQMLDKNDAKKYKGVKSLINSCFIDDISNRVFDVSALKVRPTGHRKWLSAQLETAVTISNLRGIPYAINFSSDNQMGQVKHYMVNHKLLLKFTTSYDTFKKDNSYVYVDFNKRINTGLLKEAATATGAFPLGLLPRNFKLEKTTVESFCYPRKPYEVSTASEGPVFARVSPNWPEQTVFEELSDPGRENKTYPYYVFTAVDGGMTNNEPFEVAREILLDQLPACTFMHRDAIQVDRSIIMVDPFPNSNNFAHQFQPPANLLEVIRLLVKALRNQPLFKLDDIQLASNDEVFSRFMIVPTRNDDFAKAPIACASLNGFGGFLDRNFRVHDFYLGRRNCQRFLNRRFGLPLQQMKTDNEVLKHGYDEKSINRFKYKVYFKDEKGVTKTEWYVPIIPDTNILGWNMETNDSDFSNEVGKVNYPDLNHQQLFPLLRKSIWARFRFVAGSIFSDFFSKQLKRVTGASKTVFQKILSWAGLLLGFVLFIPALPLLIALYWLVKKQLLGAIMKHIHKDLVLRKLIR